MKIQLKSKVLIILFIGVGLSSIAQKNYETKERNYSGGVALSGILDISQGKLLGLVPTGKEVSVKYDPFFEKYTIDWIEENRSARMVLKFSEENSGGKMYVDTYSSNTAYFIHDFIERDNKLTVISAYPVVLENKKVKLVFIFDDLK